MRKNLTKIVIILWLIVINLFFCSFSKIVLAGTYSESDNDKTLKRLNGNITANTVDYLQYAASNRQDAFFEFDAGGMIKQNKEINIRDGYYDNYHTSNPGVICLSPGDHKWAKTQRVDCIMDINVDGVTVYTQSKPEGKEFSRDSKNANVKKAIELADQLAYFSYMSIKNNETTQSEPWHYYKSIMRFQIFGHNSTLFSDTLGIPKVFVPSNMTSIAGDFYSEKLKEWKKATETYQYTGRIVFLNGTLLTNANNGQNDCIYSGQQRPKTSLKIKKVDPEGNPLKGVEIRIYESSSKKEKGDWLFTGLTNKDGVVNFSGEKGKWYYVREYKTISGYVKADPDHEVVKLTEDKQPVKFVNERKTTLKIVKKDQYGKNINGIKFGIWRVEKDGTKTFICSKSTNKEGVIEYKDAKIGEQYYFKEDVEYSKKLGYEPDGDTDATITIKEGENTVTIKNKLTKPKLTIIKKDSKTGELLPGATFEIYDDKGNLVKTDETDDKGQIIVLGEIGKTYRVKEVIAPTGYNLSSEDSKEVFFKEGENEVEFENEPISMPSNGQYEIKIVKVDSEDETHVLKDVEFKIVAKIKTSEPDGTETKHVNCEHVKEYHYNEFGEIVAYEPEHPEGHDVQVNKYADKVNDYYIDASGNWVKGSVDSAYVHKTNSKGIISLKGSMPKTTQNNNGASKDVVGTFVGDITAIEVKNSNYGYKQETGTEHKVIIKTSNGNTEIKNDQELGNLVIHKIDKRAYDEYGSKVPLEGVEFKVRTSESEYLQLLDSNGVVKKVNGKAVIDRYNETAENGTYIVKYVKSKEDATTFITDENGIIRIENLEVWKTPDEKYTYYMDEIAMGEKWELYYDVKTQDEAKDDNTTLSDKDVEDTNVDIENYQRYVDLAGYIWDDGHQGKNSVTDSLYQENTSDKRIEQDDLPGGKKGITIKLMQGETHLATAEAIYMDIEDEIDGKIKRDYFFPSQMKTSDSSKGITWVNPNGYKIEIEKLSEYYIEFYYNGLKYQSVPAVGNLSEYLKLDNSSKAEDKNRDIINNNFYSIKGEKEEIKYKTPNGTQGSTSTEVGLTYKSGTGEEQFTSTLVQNTKYTKESLNGSVSNIDVATSKASTQDYYEIVFIPRKDRVRKTIEYINLGIYEREQADLAIATDLDNIGMSINGYNHTYYYQKRKPYFDYGGQDLDYNKVEGQDGYKAIMDAFSVQAKNRYSDSYRNLSYIREILPSYIAYTKEDPDRDGKLRVFVNYKIVVRNQSTLSNKVRLRNYFDEHYEFRGATVGNWTCDNKVKDGGIKICEMEQEVDVGDMLEIILTFELTTDAICDLAQGNGLQTKTNTTEIITYSTYKDGNNYASIDKDSAPDNSKYGDDTTYEDDIDAAPDLTIKRDDSNKKVLTGTVFEDDIDSSTSGTQKDPSKIIKTKADEQYIKANKYEANGKFEDNEGRGQDVYVELIKKDGEVATLYDLDATGAVKHPESQMNTPEQGTYQFVGLVPGIYYIQYTYGDGEDRRTVIKPVEARRTDTIVTTQDHKSTIIKNENPVKQAIQNQYNGSDWKNIEDSVLKQQGSEGYWYEAKGADTYSSAVDDYKHRKDINEAVANNKYSIKTNYEERGQFDVDPSIYLMTSRTPLICIAIEDQDANVSKTRTAYTNSNTPVYDANKDKNDNNESSNERLPSTYETKFGIVERPRQNFEVTKEISYISVTLANGQVLVEGDPRTDGKIGSYLTYPERGSLKIEIDNEIIEGAQLNVEYTIGVANLSDYNYNTFKYYVFADDEGRRPEETSIRWIDYMDKELALVDNNWTVVESYKLRDEGYLANNTSQNNNYNYIISNGQNGNGFENGEYNYTITVAPGKISTTPINASKLLSTAKDMTYDNKVEFLNVYNSVGRFYQSNAGKTTDGLILHGTPGNNRFDTTEPDSEDKKDPDNNNEEPRRAEIIIVPPTGQTRIYYAIGISCLVLLVGGIVLIKKKVLD